MEAQKVQVTHPKQRRCKWRSQDLNPVAVAPDAGAQGGVKQHSPLARSHVCPEPERALSIALLCCHLPFPVTQRSLRGSSRGLSSSPLLFPHLGTSPPGCRLHSRTPRSHYSDLWYPRFYLVELLHNKHHSWLILTSYQRRTPRPAIWDFTPFC